MKLRSLAIVAGLALGAMWIAVEVREEIVAQRIQSGFVKQDRQLWDERERLKNMAIDRCVQNRGVPVMGFGFEVVCVRRENVVP